MDATLFDLGAPIAPTHKAPAAPRGGRRKAAAITPTSQPPSTAIHPAAPTEPTPALQLPAEAPAVEPDAPPAVAGLAPIRGPVPLPPFDPGDTSFYAQSYRLLRASPAELAEIDARHRREGFGMAPSPDALAGAISACAPVPCVEPLVRCTCDAEMPARLLEECAARAANPSVWSLHRERLAGRVGAP